MFDGCSNWTPVEVADELVSSGAIHEYELIIRTYDPLVKAYCYEADPGQLRDEVCVQWWPRGGAEDSIWKKPSIRMRRYSKKDTPSLSFE